MFFCILFFFFLFTSRFDVNLLFQATVACLTGSSHTDANTAQSWVKCAAPPPLPPPPSLCRNLAAWQWLALWWGSSSGKLWRRCRRRARHTVALLTWSPNKDADSTRGGKKNLCSFVVKRVCIWNSNGKTWMWGRRGWWGVAGGWKLVLQMKMASCKNKQTAKASFFFSSPLSPGCLCWMRVGGRESFLSFDPQPGCEHRWASTRGITWNGGTLQCRLFLLSSNQWLYNWFFFPSHPAAPPLPTSGSCYSSNNNLSWLLVPLQQSCREKQSRSAVFYDLWRLFDLRLLEGSTDVMRPSEMDYEFCRAPGWRRRRRSRKDGREEVSADWKTNRLSQTSTTSAPFPRFAQAAAVWVQSESRAGDNLTCNPSYCHLSTGLSCSRTEPSNDAILSELWLQISRWEKLIVPRFPTWSHSHPPFPSPLFPDGVAGRRRPSCSASMDSDGDVSSTWASSPPTGPLLWRVIIFNHWPYLLSLCVPCPPANWEHVNFWHSPLTRGILIHRQAPAD